MQPSSPQPPAGNQGAEPGISSLWELASAFAQFLRVQSMKQMEAMQSRPAGTQPGNAPGRSPPPPPAAAARAPAPWPAGTQPGGQPAPMRPKRPSDPDWAAAPEGEQPKGDQNGGAQS